MCGIEQTKQMLNHNIWKQNCGNQVTAYRVLAHLLSNKQPANLVTVSK